MFDVSKINLEQARILEKNLNCGFAASLANVDEIIDWLRRMYNIVIYHYTEPFVDTEDHQIVYTFGVKKLYPKHKVVTRIYIGTTKMNTDIYQAKREAIDIALKFLITINDL